MLCLFSGTDRSRAEHPDDNHVVAGDTQEPPHHLATSAVSGKDAVAPGDSPGPNIVPSLEEGSIASPEVIIALLTN